MAIVAFELDRLDKALEIINRLYKIKSLKEEDVSNNDLFKAEVLLRKKEYKDAINLFIEVIQKNKEQDFIART
ncbi:MAG: hypothetical protein U5L09_13940 [Bacteroidales bacterium]|nr:hypothetical protein [Bacteroidales bacterium]